MTLNTILKELKDFPIDRLDDLHQFIQSLTLTSKQTERDRKKIISYGGAFSSMSKKIILILFAKQKNRELNFLIAKSIYEAIDA